MKRKPPGNTPLICIEGIYAKLECTNLCGSIKDRMAKYVLDESERLGLLTPGQTIIEATSGNTGIAMSYYGRAKGYKVVIVMPENMTEERKQFIRHLGAELILCSSEGSFAEAAAIRDRMAAEHGYFNTDQFANRLNVDCHYHTTGQELIQQMREQAPQIHAFVAGVGTGGTIMGVGKALREIYPSVHLAAVEPAESAVMTGGAPGPHDIQGIGDGFIPAIVSDGHGGVDPFIDEIHIVTSAEAKATAHRLGTQHGFCVGISSGANFIVAQRLQRQYATVTTIFPDGYLKYQSQGLKHCHEGGCPYENHEINALFEKDPT